MQSFRATFLPQKTEHTKINDKVQHYEKLNNLPLCQQSVKYTNRVRCKEEEEEEAAKKNSHQKKSLFRENVG